MQCPGGRGGRPLRGVGSGGTDYLKLSIPSVKIETLKESLHIISMMTVFFEIN